MIMTLLYYGFRISYKYFVCLLLLCFLVCTPPSRSNMLKELEEPMMNTKNPLIQMDTSMGKIVLEIYQDSAPLTAKNFLQLAMGEKKYVDPNTGKNTKGPYYNGVIFHRIINSFMAQGGDIKGDGTGGPGYTIKDEINADALGLNKGIAGDSTLYQRDIQMLAYRTLNINSREDLVKQQKKVDSLISQLSKLTSKELLTRLGYEFDDKLPSQSMKKYTVAMANAGPNTNGSQFFINFVDNLFLNGKHTVFGKVLKGRSVVEEMSKVPCDPNNKPHKDIVIKKIHLLK